MKVGILVAAVAALGMAQAQAAPVVVDFDTQNLGAATTAGNITGNEFTDFGLTISAIPANNASTLALFESNCGPDFPSVSCSGNDGDLASGPSFGTSPQGRVLIISGGTDASPDDDPAGGMFVFDFLRPVTVNAVTILDLDEGAASSLVDFDATFHNAVMQSVSPSSISLLSAATGDNSLRSFNFTGLDNVTQLKVSLNNISGAIASVEVEPIPVPAALPMLASLIGGAALYQRLRRRRTA